MLNTFQDKDNFIQTVVDVVLRGTFKGHVMELKGYPRAAQVVDVSNDIGNR